MRKYARKKLKSVPTARLRRLTAQIEANLVPSLQQALHQIGPNKMLPFSATARLTTKQIEQTGTCHFEPVYGFAA